MRHGILPKRCNHVSTLGEIRIFVSCLRVLNVSFLYAVNLRSAFILAGKVFVDGRYAVGRPAQRHGYVPDRVVDGSCDGGRDGVRGGHRRRLRRRQQVVVGGEQQAFRECGPVGGRLSSDVFPTDRRHQIQVVVPVFRHVAQHGHRPRRRRRHVATIYLRRKRTDLEICNWIKIKNSVRRKNKVTEKILRKIGTSIRQLREGKKRPESRWENIKFSETEAWS